MKKCLMNYIYIYISRALILLLALFTAFSAVNAFKINADDTSTVTIIKETDDDTDKEFKFRIKASKTTETTSYEYKRVMNIVYVDYETLFIYFKINEENVTFDGYTFLHDSIYKPGYYYDYTYDDYMRFVDPENTGSGSIKDEEGYPDQFVYYYEDYSIDYIGPAWRILNDPEYNDYDYQNLGPAPSDYPDLTKEEEFNNYRLAVGGIINALFYDTEDEANSDGFYKNKHSITYKGKSYPIYTGSNYTKSAAEMVIDPLHPWYIFSDEPGTGIFIRLENKTTETTYLDLSSNPRFTPVSDEEGVYEFTVKANDSTGVTIDIPVGYTYEIEEVEDSDYTLKSINNDDVFDVKGEMGNDSEKFTFFNESKDEPTPVEPTPRVDKPKYNLPKTGIE